MKGASSADQYIIQNPEWSSCLVLLRELVSSVPHLEETIKWGIPVYQYKGKNVVGIAAFKAHVALWFYQGGLLKDESGELINAQEGTTVAMRQWRFTDQIEMEEKSALIQSYILEALQNQDLGLVIKPKKDKVLTVPAELQVVLDKDVELAAAFKAFTKSKKREYAMYIDQAKRLETKMSRLEKVIPMIKSGIGLHDKYRKS